MAYRQPQVKIIKDNTLLIYHPDVLEPITFLTASLAAGGVTLTVQNNSGFSNTDPQTLVLLENLGNSSAEIKRINGTITAGTSLTVQTGTFAHSIGTPISKILFNQFEISGANTTTATKNVIATTDLQVNNQYTQYTVSGTTYSYYWIRYYNSLATTPYYGTYSDYLQASDFTAKQVGFIVRQALEMKGENIGEKFNKDWLYDQIYLGELDVCKDLKRWSWLVELNYDLGNVTTGMSKIALPTDIEDNQTGKSIYSLRVGKDKGLDKVDKSQFNYIMQGIANSTLSTAISAGNTTVVLANSRDFPASGAIIIQGNSYDYTGNTVATNTLTGFTAFTATYDADTDVWNGINPGTPLRYTVNDGYVYFDAPIHSDYSGMNIWLDYYKTPTKIDSDGDSILVNDPYLIQLWLELQIVRRNNNGIIPQGDTTLQLYMERKQRLIDKEIIGQGVRFVPICPGQTMDDNDFVI